MSVERDNYHATALEKSHIRNYGKVVRVDVHLELRLEIKGVLVKETSVHSIVTCHTFHLCRVQKQTTARLGNVGKTDTCKSCDILTWSLAVRIVLLCYGFGANSSSVITKHQEATFHKCSFTIARKLTEEEENAFKTCVTANAVAQGFLKKSCFFLISTCYFLYELVKTRTFCRWDIVHLGDFCKEILGAMLTEFHSAKVKSTVITIKEIAVNIKFFHTYGIYALCFFEVGLTETTLNPFLAHL